MNEDTLLKIRDLQLDYSDLGSMMAEDDPGHRMLALLNKKFESFFIEACRANSSEGSSASLSS